MKQNSNNEQKIYERKCSALLEHMKNGISNIDPDSEYIISLTSYGERLETVWLTIQSIFDQTCKFAKVVLWVAHEDKDLINDKLKMLEKNGLTIRYCEDVRSYKKLIYSVKYYNDYNIITIDDDVIYPVSYFKKLIHLHEKYPQYICCYRAHEIRFLEKKILPYKEWGFHSLGIKGPSLKILPVGIGGIVYPAHSFEYEDFDLDVINEVTPYSDDIYFKWIELKKNIRVIKVHRNKKHFPYYIENTQEHSLKMLNIVSGNNNDIAISNIEDYFGKTFYEAITEK
jgi:hypothetical protein